jgi:hypothetical protein
MQGVHSRRNLKKLEHAWQGYYVTQNVVFMHGWQGSWKVFSQLAEGILGETFYLLLLVPCRIVYHFTTSQAMQSLMLLSSRVYIQLVLYHLQLVDAHTYACTYVHAYTEQLLNTHVVIKPIAVNEHNDYPPTIGNLICLSMIPTGRGIKLYSMYSLISLI